MILESHLDEKTLLQIECESDAGIHKGGTGRTGHPDRVLDGVTGVVQIIHERLLSRVLSTGVAGAEIQFGVHIDMSGNVTVSKQPTEGQFRITIRS